MTKIYEYIQKIQTYNAQNKIQDFKGSISELETLLEKYDIKEHKVHNIGDEGRGQIFIYNHYILSPKVNSQI